MEQARHAVELRVRRLSGWSRARRDLLADWHGWSAAERSTALAAFALAVLLPLLIYGRITIG